MSSRAPENADNPKLWKENLAFTKKQTEIKIDSTDMWKICTHVNNRTND